MLWIPMSSPQITRMLGFLSARAARGASYAIARGKMPAIETSAVIIKLRRFISALLVISQFASVRTISPRVRAASRASVAPEPLLQLLHRLVDRERRGALAGREVLERLEEWPDD